MWPTIMTELVSKANLAFSLCFELLFLSQIQVLSQIEQELTGEDSNDDYK